MRIFLDFEASSLNDDSYPIEVGWAGEDGSTESHLICPAEGWNDWSALAEATHKIRRKQLLAEGEPVEAVASRTLEALKDHDVYVTAPSWDGKWMSVLLRGGGLPRHALRLKDANEAHAAAAGDIGADELRALVAQARRTVAAGPPRHRALADAHAELKVFREVGRLAEERRTLKAVIPDSPQG